MPTLSVPHRGRGVKIPFSHVRGTGFPDLRAGACKTKAARQLWDEFGILRGLKPPRFPEKRLD